LIGELQAQACPKVCDQHCPWLLGCYAGWRDPFVLEKPSARSPWWYVMVGAGVRNKCGTALVYRSKDLTQGEKATWV